MKAEEYDKIVMKGVGEFFPLKTTRRKDTDPPWINDNIRRKVRRRKAIYRVEGTSAAWKRLKKATVALVKKRMKGVPG